MTNDHVGREVWSNETGTGTERVTECDGRDVSAGVGPETWILIDVMMAAYGEANGYVQSGEGNEHVQGDGPKGNLCVPSGEMNVDESGEANTAVALARNDLQVGIMARCRRVVVTIHYVELPGSGFRPVPVCDSMTTQIGPDSGIC